MGEKEVRKASQEYWHTVGECEEIESRIVAIAEEVNKQAVDLGDGIHLIPSEVIQKLQAVFKEYTETGERLSKAAGTVIDAEKTQ